MFWRTMMGSGMTLQLPQSWPEFQNRKEFVQQDLIAGNMNNA
jgi:hypothetical protein